MVCGMFGVSSHSFTSRDQPCLTQTVDDGSMRKDQREASLETIRTSGSVKCILISFKAGSTG